MPENICIALKDSVSRSDDFGERKSENELLVISSDLYRNSEKIREEESEERDTMILTNFLFFLHMESHISNCCLESSQHKIGRKERKENHHIGAIHFSNVFFSFLFLLFSIDSKITNNRPVCTRLMWKYIFDKTRNFFENKQPKMIVYLS